MQDDKRRKVAIIVPARNEEGRISEVLRAVTGSKLACEFIVVDDGSTDRTSEVAARFPGVKVLRFETNLGKAAAMFEGVRSTDARIVAYVDADLGGLKAEHIDRIILPLLNDDCDMCVGVFRGGKVWSDAAQRVLPYLSGQRAVKRDLFDAVPQIADLGMGIEVALNIAAKQRKARILRVVLRGVSNCHKETKLGIVKGTAARIKMYSEVAHAVVSSRTKRPRKRRREWKW